MANEEKRSYRVMAMQILYSMDMNNASYQEALEFVNKELVTEEVTNLVKYVSDNLAKIDEIITRSLTNYTINRLNFVDKAIIRVSTAELLIGKLDKRIIIDEALEITKLFSDEGNHKAVAFNNRLLQSISDNIK
ncbi:MAG: transcription antitermination protein NusB [Acholeplasmatales bacterium]|nr:transcription antitermination protein NusB [Acholeplasmatales bacterium]